MMAALLGVVAIGHCQAFADHTGQGDPCTNSLAIITVSLTAVALHVFRNPVPPLAGFYRLEPIDISTPPPER